MTRKELPIVWNYGKISQNVDNGEDDVCWSGNGTGIVVLGTLVESQGSKGLELDVADDIDKLAMSCNFPKRAGREIILQVGKGKLLQEVEEVIKKIRTLENREARTRALTTHC